MFGRLKLEGFRQQVMSYYDSSITEEEAVIDDGLKDNQVATWRSFTGCGCASSSHAPRMALYSDPSPPSSRVAEYATMR